MFFYIKRILKRAKYLYKKSIDDKNNNKLKKSVRSCGNDLSLFGKLELMFSENITIGNSCKLNDKVYINARNGVEIGDDVTISYDAKLISTGYDLEHWIQKGEKIHKQNSPIYIGNHCWIGAGAIILPGVQITGEYVIIGAGAVVTKDITESKVLVAGVPAKIVKKLGEEN